MMEKLWKDETEHDITIAAKNNQTTTLHRCILMTIPFFKAYISKQFKSETIELKKDATTIKMLKIEFNQYSIQTVKEMVRHLYLKTFSDAYSDKSDNIVEMLYLSNYINSKEMEELSVLKLNNDTLLHEGTILQIATAAKKLNNTNLTELCSWYFKSKPNWFDDTEFDKLSFTEVFNAYLITLNYETPPPNNKMYRHNESNTKTR